MASALLDTFHFKELASDDLELEVLLNLDDLVDSFDNLSFKILPDGFDFLPFLSSASSSQFRPLCLKMNTLWSCSLFDYSSGIKMLQCSSWFSTINLKMSSY